MLLPEAECEKRLARARQHGAPPMKALKEECRKMKTCVHCGAYNGTVKKGTEGLKIVHAKFAAVGNDIDALVRQFEYSCQVNEQADLERTLPGTYEDLDPLRVHEIFAKIRDADVPLFRMHPDLSRPADLLITHMPAPPVCLRPAACLQHA